MTPLVSCLELEITVLVDNVSDALSTTPPGVEDEMARLWARGASELSGTCLCSAAHGLSLLLTATNERRRARILFDAGPEGDVFVRNASRLGVELGEVDTIVLSHGHWDHAGGLLSALDVVSGHARRSRVRVACHPHTFRRRALRMASGWVRPFAEIPGADVIAARGGDVRTSRDAELLAGGLFYLSGEIPRVTSFERGMPTQVHWTEEGWLPDTVLEDERWLGIRVDGCGLIVVSACSHAGIANILSDVRRVFGDEPIAAVVGGLHLAGGNERIISATLAALEPFGVRTYYPGHCTGYRGVSALIERFGDASVVPLSVGKRLLFHRRDGHRR